MNGLTLPTDSTDRKGVPMASGVLAYFPATLVEVARISKAGNDKHNPGQPLHWARGKSNDHADCILRHLTDLQDLLRDYHDSIDDMVDTEIWYPNAVAELNQKIRTEVGQLAWRALALGQETLEELGAPLAPGAKHG